MFRDIDALPPIESPAALRELIEGLCDDGFFDEPVELVIPCPLPAAILFWVIQTCTLGLVALCLLAWSYAIVWIAFLGPLLFLGQTAAWRSFVARHSRVIATRAGLTFSRPRAPDWQCSWQDLFAGAEANRVFVANLTRTCFRVWAPQSKGFFPELINTCHTPKAFALRKILSSTFRKEPRFDSKLVLAAYAASGFAILLADAVVCLNLPVLSPLQPDRGLVSIECLLNFFLAVALYLIGFGVLQAVASIATSWFAKGSTKSLSPFTVAQFRVWFNRLGPSYTLSEGKCYRVPRDVARTFENRPWLSRDFCLLLALMTIPAALGTASVPTTHYDWAGTNLPVLYLILTSAAFWILIPLANRIRKQIYYSDYRTFKGGLQVHKPGGKVEEFSNRISEKEHWWGWLLCAFLTHYKDKKRQVWVPVPLLEEVPPTAIANQALPD